MQASSSFFAVRTELFIVDGGESKVIRVCSREKSSLRLASQWEEAPHSTSSARTKSRDLRPWHLHCFFSVGRCCKNYKPPREIMPKSGGRDFSVRPASRARTVSIDRFHVSNIWWPLRRVC